MQSGALGRRVAFLPLNDGGELCSGGNFVFGTPAAVAPGFAGGHDLPGEHWLAFVN